MIRLLNRVTHAGMDAIMCAMMNRNQWRLRRQAVSRENLDAYLEQCEHENQSTFYATPDENSSLRAPEWRRDANLLSWNSPIQGPHEENNTARALLFETTKPSGAPTLILLHALMSANDFGYRRIARRFNARGWNVLFPHLPYHYSRRPKGYGNGELAITSDLIRNAETLRQAVIETRQLMGWARRGASRKIAILATSYGAWIASLCLSREMTDFTILLQPVADVRHITFESPASSMMSDLLFNNNVLPELIDRHAHLSSPVRVKPLNSPDRITIIGGKYDLLSPSEKLKSLCSSWGGARYREVHQGHFGYSAMRCALEETEYYMTHSATEEHG
jgi:hypothetical protein